MPGTSRIVGKLLQEATARAADHVWKTPWWELNTLRQSSLVRGVPRMATRQRSLEWLDTLPEPRSRASFVNFAQVT
jgi:hypothetical protein